jgi:hypothetical protein
MMKHEHRSNKTALAPKTSAYFMPSDVNTATTYIGCMSTKTYDQGRRQVPGSLGHDPGIGNLFPLLFFYLKVLALIMLGNSRGLK